MELLLCFVIVFGIVTFILTVREVSYKKVFRSRKSSALIIIPLSEEDFSEIYLKFYIDTIKNNNIDLCKVILLDTNLTSEQCEICDKICDKNEMIEFLKGYEVVDYIGALLK